MSHSKLNHVEEKCATEWEKKRKTHLTLPRAASNKIPLKKKENDTRMSHFYHLDL